jgi:hypothetical protein
LPAGRRPRPILDLAAAGGRPTIIATVALKDLHDGSGTGHTENGTVLPIPALRRLGCDADLIRHLHDSTGNTLDFGRKTRIVSQPLRRYLVSRDGGCVFGGCEIPPSGCEAHHKTPWLDGGHTNPENTLLLCRYHHHLVHEGGWTLTGNPEIDGDLSFHPPPGRNKPPMPAERKTLHHDLRKLLTTSKERYG